MDDMEGAERVFRSGLMTEALGPQQEWSPVDAATFQRRHTEFWSSVTRIIEAEPGDYEELPSWMTEDATELLKNN